MRALDGDSLDRGLPFECSSLWRPSTFATKSGDNDNFFRIPAFALDPLELPPETQIDDSPFRIPDNLTFGPDHEQPDHPTAEASSHDADTSTSLPAVLDRLDLWEPDMLDAGHHDGPRLLTWEAFEGELTDCERHPTYFSEAGASIFDAALATGPQRHLTPGVLPQDATIRALSALILGRSSVFFSWEAKEDHFVQTLRNVPISGYSVQCCSNFIHDLLEYGTLVRNLRDFSSVLIGKRSPLPSVTALRRCIDVILDSLESFLSDEFHCLQSIQQLQHAVDHPRQLLDTLRSLSNCVKNATTEEQAISAISDRVHVIAESGSLFSALMREILVRVCEPWLTALSDDLGLGNSSPLRAMTSEDDVSAHEAIAELPNFVAFEDYTIVREAKTSLRILLKYDDTTSSELQKRTADRTPLKSSAGIAMSAAVNQIDPDKLLLDELELPFIEVQQSTSPIEDDVLVRLTEEIFGESTNASPNDLLLEPDPYDTWRPLVTDQRNWISHRLLHHLFIDRKLLKHLELQHQFHLFGSGEFISHLSKALFSSDTQTAERRRGVLPTSQTMGLRLGAVDKQTWPPASSELRLTLLGILNDVYYGTTRNESTSHVDMPGGLSFSIRELPDADIERVMDPTSIYALDFLRLQYTAPAPLDVILTPATMARYDEIFRHMLRMVRMLDVVIQLRKQSLKKASADESKPSIEVHHVITVLMSHFVDSCINEPWSDFKRDMLELDAIASAETLPNGDVKGMQYLHDQHATCIDRVRARLFLRKRQAVIRGTLEAVFSTTLDMYYQRGGASAAELSAKFRSSVSELLVLLQGIVDKPVIKNRKTADTCENEAIHSARILFARLNYNGFYRQDL